MPDQPSDRGRTEAGATQGRNAPGHNGRQRHQQGQAQHQGHSLCLPSHPDTGHPAGHRAHEGCAQKDRHALDRRGAEDQHVEERQKAGQGKQEGAGNRENAHLARRIGRDLRIGLGRARRCRIELSALGFAHDQFENRCQGDACQTNDDEGRPPVQRVGNPAPGDLRAGDHAKGAADRDPQRIDRQRPGAFGRRVIVGNDGVGRGHTAGLAHANPDPGQEQLGEVLCKPADRRETAPDRQRDGHDPGPVHAIGEPGDGHTQRGIKQREGDTAQQTQLLVAQAELFLDRNGEDGNDLPVQEIERIHQKQKQHDNAAITCTDMAGRAGCAALIVCRHDISPRRSGALTGYHSLSPPNMNGGSGLVKPLFRAKPDAASCTSGARMQDVPHNCDNAQEQAVRKGEFHDTHLAQRRTLRPGHHRLLSDRASRHHPNRRPAG